MSLNLAVLRVIKRREQFDKVEKFINNTGIDGNTQTMINCFRQYFVAHPNDHMIDMDIFRHLFFNKWFPKLTVETAQVYSILIERICDDVTVEQQASIVNSLIENEMVTLVANDIDEYQGEGEFDIVQRIEERHRVAKQLMEIVATCDYATVETLNDKPVSSCSYMWPLQGLASTCRRIEGGDNIAIAALSDVGKTAFALQVAVSIARQAKGKPVIWFNNEGARERIQKRAYAMMLGVTADEVENMRITGTLQANLIAEFGIENPVRIYDVHGMNSSQLEELIKRTDEEGGVAAVIWDMIANVPLANEASYSRDDKVMEAKYQWTRMLGVQYDFPNFLPCQQSHDKEWVQWPSKHMLKDSKIGVQGALDMLLFITQPEEASLETMRYLCAPKNKLSIIGAPTLRMHAKFNKMQGVIYEE